jgi:hypothetical protein
MLVHLIRASLLCFRKYKGRTHVWIWPFLDVVHPDAKLTNYTILNAIGLTQEVQALNPRAARAHSML